MRTAAFLVLTALLITAVSCTTPVQYQKPLQVYAKAAYYNYRDKDGGDAKETGAVFSAGIEWTVPTIYLRFTGEVFGGPGTRELGDADGAEADVVYYGGFADVDFIYPFVTMDATGDTVTTVLTPYAGIGYRTDVHDIDDFDSTVTFAPSKTTYQNAYAHLGFEGRTRMSPTMWFIWDLALGYQLTSDLKIRSVDDDTIKVEPDLKPMVFAEVGLDWQTVFATIFFDYMQWGTDNTDTYDQGKTDQWSLGIRIGWSF